LPWVAQYSHRPAVPCPWRCSRALSRGRIRTRNLPCRCSRRIETRNARNRHAPNPWAACHRSHRVPFRVELCQEYPPSFCGHDNKDLGSGGCSRMRRIRSGAFGVARANTMRVSGVSLSVYGRLSDVFRRDRSVGMAYAYGTEPTSQETGMERDGPRCLNRETSRGTPST
jgi:hypothetical protein